MLKASVKTKASFGRMLEAEFAQIQKQHERAAIEVADFASKRAQLRVIAKMASAGLGNLGKAVGHTSTKRSKKGHTPGRAPYGVIFAKGDPEGRSAQALEIYSQGGPIRPQKASGWLAFPTRAAPKFVSYRGRRRRLTPEMWKDAGLNKKIGELIFRKVSDDRAMLVVRGTTLDPKTGRARRGGARAPKTRVDKRNRDVAMFILIKRTYRTKRFDQRAIMAVEDARVPDYLRRTLAGYNQGR